jgi:hypothetical protein
VSRTWRIAAEIAAWSLFVVPLAVLLTARRLLGYGRGLTPEQRADALLAWYPAAWREQHGAELRAILLDTIAAGRGDVRMGLDVAREGLVERGRAIRWERVRAGFLIGLGWTMFFPQGVVAAALTQFAIPPSWFLALNIGGDEQWLVIGLMAGIGLLLVDRGMHVYAVDCERRRTRYGSSAG